MNIHQRINHRSQFAHQFQKQGCFKDSIISLSKGFLGDSSRPHKDRRNFGHIYYKHLGYIPYKNHKYKYHSQYSLK